VFPDVYGYGPWVTVSPGAIQPGDRITISATGLNAKRLSVVLLRDEGTGVEYTIQSARADGAGRARVGPQVAARRWRA